MADANAAVQWNEVEINNSRWTIPSRYSNLTPLGHGVHPNFGEVMVKIGERLGISPTGENLMEWSGKWLKKQKC
jgi:hypothetical protein